MRISDWSSDVCSSDLAPTDGLTLSAAVAYTDAEFTETFISNAGIDLKGRAAPRAPKWSGNLSFDWEIPISDSLDFSVFGLANYSGSYFADATTLNEIGRASCRERVCQYV